MGYQNSTFPMAIYGCIDTATRKMLWLRIWVTNSDPNIIGRWYLEHLYETRVMPSFIRVDQRTEIGVMATMHAFLRRNHGDIDDPCDTVLYGPSTSNQVSMTELNTLIMYYASRSCILFGSGISQLFTVQLNYFFIIGVYY